jgi:hypothetical protein
VTATEVWAEPPAPVARSSLPTAVAAVAGLGLVLSVFLVWYTTQSVGGATMGLNGEQLAQFVPEVMILPAIGLGLIGGAIVQSTRARLPEGSRIPAISAIVLGLVGVVIAVEIAWRFSPTALTTFGSQFFDAVGPGWFLAVGGSVLALGIGFVGYFRR